MDRREFLKPESMYGVFQIGTFSVLEFLAYFLIRVFFESLIFFSHVIYPFVVSVISFPLPYFTSEHRIVFLVCLRAFSKPLVEFSILIVLLYPVLASLKSSFFRQKLMIYVPKFCGEICRLFCFALFIPIYSRVLFLFPLYFHLSKFLYLSFESNFPSRFFISVRVSVGHTDFFKD